MLLRSDLRKTENSHLCCVLAFSVVTTFVKLLYDHFSQSIFQEVLETSSCRLVCSVHVTDCVCCAPKTTHSSRRSVRCQCKVVVLCFTAKKIQQSSHHSFNVSNCRCADTPTVLYQDNHIRLGLARFVCNYYERRYSPFMQKVLVGIHEIFLKF